MCDWWYNVKCEDSTEFFDLNLDVMLLEGGAGGAGEVDRPASRLSNLPDADEAITNQGFTITKFRWFVRGGGASD